MLHNGVYTVNHSHRLRLMYAGGINTFNGSSLSAQFLHSDDATPLYPRILLGRDTRYVGDVRALIASSLISSQGVT